MASISVGQDLSGATITINQILPTTEMPTPDVNGGVGDGEGYFEVSLYGDSGDDWVSCGGILKSDSYVIAYGGLYTGAGGHTTTKWSVFTAVEYVDSVIVAEITNEVGFTFTLPEDFGTVTQIPTNTTYLDRLSFDISVPTPDWANCFVKTASGNKAVEKVWIKQNGQLVTVYATASA